MKPIDGITALGQSLWLDNIQRRMLNNGELRGLIEAGEIRGLTSNPSIFNNAISKGQEYSEAIRSLSWSGWGAEQIFWELGVEDIRRAADLLLPLYRSSDAADGYVSLEVSPRLARDTAGTLRQAEQLWARVARPNLMVKIPATEAGLPAIRQAIAAGINVNVTLIFSLSRYEAVMESYISGLEERLAAGKDIRHVASVASFFVSRTDSKVDPLLPAESSLRGKLAIASAKAAYALFARTFAGMRWQRLHAAGGCAQRPLWASTSTKNPDYPDTLYVDSLIGPQTVNTLPPQTLVAARDHAAVRATLAEAPEQAWAQIAAAREQGIELEAVACVLEQEGVKAFEDAFDDLLKSIEAKRLVALAELGPLAGACAAGVAKLEATRFNSRMWARDGSLWSADAAGQREAEHRLGWLRSVELAGARLPEYHSFAAEVGAAGLRKVLVLGMGGSSLTAEVLGSVMKGYRRLGIGLEVGILDSTHPAQVLAAADAFPSSESLYIVASKSGGTAEVSAAFEYFYAKVGGDGSHFAAITDPGTSLADKAGKLRFRRVFEADSQVGGRFSALTDFGLVPAALMGLDVLALLSSADAMIYECAAELPEARSVAIVLGALLASAAQNGRNKLVLVSDHPVRALADWVEQIVAESTGKHGRGIVPVICDGFEGGPGSDQLGVYFRSSGTNDQAVAGALSAGFPVITLGIDSIAQLGAEFVRWEIAVAAACHLLGVNAFDQPDVQASKVGTETAITAFRASGRLDEGIFDWDLRENNGGTEKGALAAFVKGSSANGYLGINAYLPRTADTFRQLADIRIAAESASASAVTVGFGPRFQHSTGQLHKGGPANCRFLQIVDGGAPLVEIPGAGLDFGTLIRAQALGDFKALAKAGRPVFRIRVSGAEDLRVIAQAIAAA